MLMNYWNILKRPGLDRRKREVIQSSLVFLAVRSCHLIVGDRRTKPQFPPQLWNVYTRVVRDLPRSNNSIEGWHQAFNRRVSMKHPTLTKLANCIMREQSKFELDIERIRVGQEPKPQKKIYATIDLRLKRVVASYKFESVNDYLANIAANVKLNC